MTVSRPFDIHVAEQSRMRLLLGTMIALIVADGLISRFLIARGFASEGNPFLQPLIGGNMFLALKLGGSLLAALILRDIHRRLPRVSLIVTLFFVIFYTLLNFWSLFIFFFTSRV
ncbi:MAG: DUF5658 family protein [Dehalococcoidia bacterium]|nr:DUF5658 family protein [Dehalococcoidia bacterium]